jgi:hypothetical protein
MAATPRRPGRSFADDRELFEMAKTLDLKAIVKKTGRRPASVLKAALRIGAVIKGRPKPKARPVP